MILVHTPCMMSQILCVGYFCLMKLSLMPVAERRAASAVESPQEEAMGRAGPATPLGICMGVCTGVQAPTHAPRRRRPEADQATALASRENATLIGAALGDRRPEPPPSDRPALFATWAAPVGGSGPHPCVPSSCTHAAASRLNPGGGTPPPPIGGEERASVDP